MDGPPGPEGTFFIFIRISLPGVGCTRYTRVGLLNYETGTIPTYKIKFSCEKHISQYLARSTLSIW